MCGRIPVESSVVKLLPDLAALGFSVSSGRISVATFVDNLFAFSDGAAKAVQQLDILASELRTSWDLNIKPCSREWMACSGSNATLRSEHSWQEVKVFNALGHLVSCDGSAAACFERTACYV